MENFITHHNTCGSLTRKTKDSKIIMYFIISNGHKKEKRMMNVSPWVNGFPCHLHPTKKGFAERLKKKFISRVTTSYFIRTILKYFGLKMV